MWQIRDINIRHNFNFYQLPSNLTFHQKRAYYFGITLFIDLSLRILKFSS